MRFVRLLALALVLPGAPAAVAAPVPCNLLTDPANDVKIRVVAAGQSTPYVDPAVDIQSADLVSDPTGLGVTLRVAGIGATSTSTTHTGLGLPQVEYRVFLTLESVGRELIFSATGYADNAAGYAWTAIGGKWNYFVGRYLNDSQHKYADEYFIPYGSTRGTVDAAKSEIRMSVPWAELKKYGYTKAKRDRAVKIRARAMDSWLSQSYEDDVFDPGNVRYDGAPRDEATTNGTYTLGAKTCTARL